MIKLNYRKVINSFPFYWIKIRYLKFIVAHLQCSFFRLDCEQEIKKN